jgi:hypothetical protein
MNWLKTLLAKFASASKPEEIVMTDPNVPNPEVAAPAPAPVDTNKLKALLLALGHDIEAKWEHLLALSK